MTLAFDSSFSSDLSKEYRKAQDFPSGIPNRPFLTMPNACLSFPFSPDIEPWHRLDEVFDNTWFVDTPIEQAMERIFKVSGLEISTP